LVVPPPPPEAAAPSCHSLPPGKHTAARPPTHRCIRLP
jgi:hypothetical protein